MMNSTEIIQKIKDENIKLLSQIEVSESEYEDLKAYVTRIANASYKPSVERADIMTALALVQIAIRCYKEGNYWERFYEETGTEKSLTTQMYLGRVFDTTLHKYALFEIEKVNNRSAYVENVKAHAFVTNAYIKDFFNFAYSFYENNLCRQLDETLSEDLEDLSAFMKSVLGDGDIIRQERGMASKSYRLTKSTKEVFAGLDTKCLYTIFYPILKMIDNWFFDDDTSKLPHNRFGRLFKEWCIKREAEENESKRRSALRNLSGRRPYLKIDGHSGENIYLIIPQQKFKKDVCNGYANAEININGRIVRRNLELYNSYGNYISEEERIKLDIHDLFNAISVNITGLEKAYKIPAKNYRFFDENFRSISRIKKGRVYLIAAENTKVVWQNTGNKSGLPMADIHNGYKRYSVEFDDYIRCSIDGEKFAVSENVKLEPFYENIIDNFEVYHKNEKITAARNHPKISFFVDKERLFGIKLLIEEFGGFLGNAGIINKYEKNIRAIEDVLEYEEYISDDSKYIVTLELEKVLNSSRDGIYNISLDIPGKSNKILCKYCLLGEFNCDLKNRNGFPLFMDGDVAEIELFTDNYTVEFCNDSARKAKPSDGYNLKYTFLVSHDDKEAKIILNTLDIIIKIPINVFTYSFSSPDDMLPKQEYIWYSDVSNVLFVKVSDCETVSAYFGNKVNECVVGEKVNDKKGIYRIDIEEIHDKIQSYSDVFCYINLVVNHKKYGAIPIPLPKVLRKLYITPYFELKFNGAAPYIDVKIIGDAELCLTVKNEYGNIVIEDKKIKDGINELPELKSESKYTFCPTMVEDGVFFDDDVKTELKFVERKYIDTSNLVGKILNITGVIYKGKRLKLKEDYSISIVSKSVDGESYNGKRYILVKNNKLFQGVDKINVKTESTQYIISLKELSKEQEWHFLYYNTGGERIVSYDRMLAVKQAGKQKNESKSFFNEKDENNEYLELKAGQAIFEVSAAKFENNRNSKSYKLDKYKIGDFFMLKFDHNYNVKKEKVKKSVSKQCNGDTWAIVKINDDTVCMMCKKCGRIMVFLKSRFETSARRLHKL